MKKGKMNNFKRMRLRSIALKELAELDRADWEASVRTASDPIENELAGDYHDLNDYELQQELHLF